MIFASFLVLHCVSALNSLSQPWLPLHNSITLSNVSEACRNDTNAWLHHIFEFEREFDLCFVQDDPNCTEETKQDLRNNIYAIKQLDAFGRLPPGILDVNLVGYGSQQECREVSERFVYETQYCFLKSVPKKSECSSLVKYKSAVCMPKSCNEEEITQIFNEIAVGPVHHCKTTCISEEGKTDTFTWIFAAFMGTLIGICLIGSIIDYFLNYNQANSEKFVKHPGIQLFTSFSIFSNGSQILDTRPPRKGHLQSLDCMRFISMVWVVSGHIGNFYMFSDSIPSLFDIPNYILNDTLLNAWFSVDTFFVLSGLLVAYMFFKMADKNPRMVKNPFAWILFYVHRYLRLTPPYMLFICFVIAVVPLFTGVLTTLWNVDALVVEGCRKNWWQNLLYINNFNNKNPCYGVSWYLACDTQMYLAAPVVLVALYYSHKIGVASILAIGTGSVAACMTIMMKNDMAGDPTMPHNRMKFMKYIYTTPWIRCTPYLLGMHTGYLLAKYGQKKIRINPIISLVCWCLAISTALAVIYGPYEYFALKTHWSPFVRAFYYSFSRIGWGLFICWVIVANHFGWAGPISSFMCHPLWQPLGRLSYTAYIVHLFIIIYFWNLFDRPLHFTSIGEQFLTCTIPIVVMAYVFAFFWSCLCELPFLKLEKMLIDGITGGSRKRDQKSRDVLEEKPVNLAVHTIPEMEMCRL